MANQGINIGPEKLGQYLEKSQQELSQILTAKSLRKMNVPEGYIAYVKEEIKELFRSVSLEEDLFRNCRYDAKSLAEALYKKYKGQKKILLNMKARFKKSYMSCQNSFLKLNSTDTTEIPEFTMVFWVRV